MDTSNCKIIAIEGIDGSGKSLQFQLLTKAILDRNKTVLTLSFPCYDGFFGKEIGAMLSGKQQERADRVDPKSMALWYAVDRWKKFSQVDYASYDYLLLNRYTLSNAVYQSLRVEPAQRKEFLSWLLCMEHEEFSLPVPDVYLFLDVDENLSKENVKQKGYRDYTGDDPDVYESSPSLMSKARQTYIDFISTMDNGLIVNSMVDKKMIAPETIHNEIVRLLNL